MVLHLFVDGRVFASDNRESLRELGDMFMALGLTDNYQIVPLGVILAEAYIV